MPDAAGRAAYADAEMMLRMSVLSLHYDVRETLER